MKKCLYCEKEITAPKFCNNSCSAKYNNKNRVYKASKDKRTKVVSCKECKKEINVNIRSDAKKCLCVDCKKKRVVKRERTKECYYCGQRKCLKPNICRKNNLFKTLVKYFGFDETAIGTVRLYEEFERIRDILHDEYHKNELCLAELVEKYNHYGANNLGKILNSLGIKLRSLSDSVKLSIYKGRLIIHVPQEKYKYKQGWHTTWNGKKVFYRSGYELNYCKILDDQTIEYEMEKLRFWYWDSEQQKQRVAIPDFHIPEDNLIVEIKSNFTLDEQNMLDKMKAYREHGYNFKLILEGKETNL